MRSQHILTWITAVLENLFFAGAMNGWPNFISVLEKEKFFIDACNVTSTNTSSCLGQSNNLSFIFTLSSAVAYFTAILTGKLLDKYGVWFVRTLMINVAAICYIIVAFVPTTSSYALYICFPLIQICGYTLYLQKFQTANLFPERTNFYMASVSGAFDSGAVVFLIFNKLYFEFSVSYKTLLCLYAAVYFMLNARTFLLTPRYTVSKDVSRSHEYGYTELFAAIKAKDNNNNSFELLEETRENNQKESLKKYLLKPYFLTSMLSVVIVNFLLAFYISNFNIFIKSTLGVASNQEQVAWYSNKFGIVQLCAVIFASIYGILIDFYQKKLKDERTADIRSCLVGIWCSSGTAVLLLIFMLVPSAKLQISSMILVIMTSSFFFSANSAFLTSVLPPGLQGRLFGVLSFANGAALLLQQPVRFLVTDALDNWFLPVTLCLLLLSFLLVLHPLCILRNLKRLRYERLRDCDEIDLFSIASRETDFCKVEAELFSATSNC